MGLYTRITRDWLEHRYRRRSDAGVYFAHMPVYGFGHPDAEGGHLRRLARMLQILRALDRLPFTSLLDVGGAEGYLAEQSRRLFGASTATTDLSHEACRRARELFALPAAAVDSARLPFADGAFDVVVCSEVIEHVEQPVATLLELQRLARVAVVLTTEEVHHDQAAIDDYLWRRPGWPHMERNLFHPDDLAACLPGARLSPQCDREPPAELADLEAARQWLREHTREHELAPGRIGVLAVIPGPQFAAQAPRHPDERLLDALFRPVAVPGARAPAPKAAADQAWFTRLRDPITRAPLAVEPGGLRGSRLFPVVDGIPDFLDPEAAGPSHDELAARAQRLPTTQRQALLRLAERLHLPERWPQDHFDLRRRDDQRGFWTNPELVPRGEGFCWRSIGSDPWIVTPCLARPLRTVELVLRVHNPAYAVDAGVGQLYWKGPGDESFGEDRMVLFPVQNDGRVHTYRIDLAHAGGSPRDVQWLRIDPINGPAEVDLLELRLA